MEEVCDRDAARLTRFPSDGIQDQDGLCAKLRADPSAGGADEEGVDGHKDTNKEVFHSIHSKRYLTSCSISNFLRKSMYSS